MTGRSSLLLLVCLSCVAGTAWSAGRDTIKPGPITGLTVQPTIRALTLRFVATGDDGTSGTAAGYDIRVKAMLGNCSGDPSAWPVAPNTAVPRNGGPSMAASGSTDFANVRPLAPNTTYCVAIRAFDEVPNYSATWTVASQTTLAGDWPMASIAAPTAGTYPSAKMQEVALDEITNDPNPALLTSWVISAYTTRWVNSGIGFARVAAPQADSTVPTCGAADCYEQILLTNPLLSAYLDALDVRGVAVAAIPGPNAVAGLLVQGTKTVSGVAQERTVLLERGATPVWTSQLVPNVSEPANEGATPTSLIYLPDAQTNPGADPNGAWNPAFTWERVDSDAPQRHATLMLAERAGGVWSSTALFARISTSGMPAFKTRKLFLRADNSLAIYATPTTTSNGVYAVRDQTGAWTYFDAGPHYQLNYGVAPVYAAGLDENGQLLVAASPYLLNNIGLIRQSSFAGPFSGLPPQNPPPVVDASAWSTVFPQSIDFNSATLMGVFSNVCTNGTVQIATMIDQQARTREVRVVSVHPDGTVDVTRGDRVDGVTTDFGAVGLPNGDMALTYEWGRAPDFTLVARARNGNCP